MDLCSYFVKDRALFGSFPTQDSVKELEEHGVRYFVNLTLDSEKKITPYATQYNYIHYPIVDNQIPTNWKSYAQFIIRISKIIFNLQKGELLLIHCKGGHGRSGLVVASILCHMFGITPEDALRRTTKYHSNRLVMRDKWRKIGSPQTRLQKNLVYKFFEPLRFCRQYKTGYTTGFSNFSQHSVCVPELGLFPTAEAAFQAHKNTADVDYVEKQKNARTPMFSNYIGNRCVPVEDWEEKKDMIMEMVIRLKIEQNEDIGSKLLNTGLRPLVEHNTRGDSYWGDGLDGKGMNKLGKILMKIRNEMYENM